MSDLSVRPLPALNDNYNPPRPWACVTFQDHDCTGNVIGAVGAIPVCVAGAVAEATAREIDRQRREALMASPEFQRQVAWEIALERKYS